MLRDSMYDEELEELMLRLYDELVIGALREKD